MESVSYIPAQKKNGSKVFETPRPYSVENSMSYTIIPIYFYLFWVKPMFPK